MGWDPSIVLMLEQQLKFNLLSYVACSVCVYLDTHANFIWNAFIWTPTIMGLFGHPW